MVISAIKPPLESQCQPCKVAVVWEAIETGWCLLDADTVADEPETVLQVRSIFADLLTKVSLARPRCSDCAKHFAS